MFYVFIAKLINSIHRGWIKYVNRVLCRSCLGFCGNNVDLRFNGIPSDLSRVFMCDNTNIYHDFRFVSVTGKFIMKRNSGAAAGLTVITGNHQRKCGVFFKEISGNHTVDLEKDVVVEEDVWIGANVTLLPGVTIGRGATIGAGSVCIKSVPPYAIVMGNPAKVVGFNFNPEEVIEHERTLYQENERLPIEMLERNYNKYYLNRIDEIKTFFKL